MMRSLAASVIAMAGLWASAQAAPPDPKLILRALDDEMRRNMMELKLGDLERPYHMDYTLTLRRRVGCHAILGNVEDIDSGTTATVNVRIRVGGPRFDNTNFFDVGLGFFGSSDDEESFRNRSIPFELNYENLRRELWLATDACYKQSVELYAKKQAAIKNRTRTDTTWDFFYMAPEELTDLDNGQLTASVSDARRLCVEASGIFKNYPDIQSSRVGFEFVPEEIYYVNSEGRRTHKFDVFCGVEMIAASQAADGMPVAETYAAYAIRPGDLPTKDSLLRAAETMARALTSMVKAPTIDAYSGPVLFEGQAAGEIVAQVFAPNLVAQRSPLSDGGFSTNDRYQAFQNKIGGRVLPEFMSARAVPLQKTIGGQPVAGHYMIDDEGMRAMDVTLVDKGYLKTLLSSRVPTKRIRISNGHQRGGAAMISTIELMNNENKRALDDKGMKARLLKLVKDRELPYGIIVRKALNQNLLFTGIFPMMGTDFPIPQGESKMGIVEAYRLYSDGREELIRGTEAAGLSASIFKDIIATGRTTRVHNLLAPAVNPAFLTGGSSYTIATTATPDLLFEDIEIKPIEGDFPKPPILPNPLAGN